MADSSFAKTLGSPWITPGKFIISARPITLGWLSLANCSASKTAPEVSMSVAGTQDGAITSMSRGVSSESASMNSTPFRPQTLAIS